MLSSSRLKVAVLLLLFAVAWFANIQYRDLFNTDEGRYAEIPREMVVSGNWVTPHLDGLKYFEKPAMQYWLTAGAYVAFGEHTWTARLWTVVSGLLGLLFTYYAGLRLFDRRTGFLSAAVLAGSAYYSAMGHINTLDMGLTFFMTVSLFAFLLAQGASKDRAEQRLWMLLSFASAGGAVLSKGLIGIVIPGAVLVLYSLAKRDWGLWKRLHLVPGLAVFLVVTCPWFVVVSERNPKFFWYFFIREHFERYLTPISHRHGAWWYFIPIFLLGVMPWLVQSGRGLLLGFQKSRRTNSGRFDTPYFLWVWVVFILLFFTVSDSKLPSYILPVMPAFALLLGRQLVEATPSQVRTSAYISLAFGAIALFYLPYIGHNADARLPLKYFMAFVPWVQVGVAVLLAGSVLCIVWAGREKPDYAVTALAMAWFLGVQIVGTGTQTMAPALSTHYLVRQLGDKNDRSIPFYSVNQYEQTLPFYLKRTVTLVGYRGELNFGLKQAPNKWVPDDKAFAERWKREPQALAVMSHQLYAEFRAQGLPMKVLARDPRRIVVEKP